MQDMSKENIQHEYTSTKHSLEMVIFRVGNYCVLITFIAADKIWGIKVPDACYYMDVFAILGGDIQQLFTRFFKLK